jgi:large subunit ribosomal protein L19
LPKKGFCDKVFLQIFMANTALIKKIKFTPVDAEARQKLNFSAGDTVKVWSKIPEEKGKFRLQAFEGIVLARKHGLEPGATFTVRKVASGVGVERIFPLYSPMIDKIEITKKARARRSKLYYIRHKAVRDVRRKMRSVVVSEEEAESEAEPAAAPAAKSE